MKNTYYDDDLSGFTDEEKGSLRAEIEGLGFKEVFPGKGGGGGEGEVVRQVIAYLTIHHDAIIENLISDVLLLPIVAISSKLYNWFKRSKKVQSNKNTQFLVSINVHFAKSSQIQIFDLNISREYSQKEIEDILKNTKLETVDKDHFNYEENEN